mgnify:CR=1 FL=1
METALASRPEIAIEINWHTFQLNPMMPREGMNREDYLDLKFDSPDKAKRLYANISTVGEELGINFEFTKIQRTPNTLLAHRLIRYAKIYGAEMQSQIVEQLFNSYFIDGEDIGNIEILTELGFRNGIPNDDLYGYLKSEKDLKAVKQEDMEARQLGIQGVPFFILDGQYAISGAQEPEAFHPLFDMLAAQIAL